MRYTKFLAFNASGGILWAGVYTFAAYYAGSQLNKVSTVVTIVFVVVAVVVIIVGIVLVRRHFDALRETAEKAFPGPLYQEGGGGGATFGDEGVGDTARGEDEEGAARRAEQGAGAGERGRASRGAHARLTARDR